MARQTDWENMTDEQKFEFLYAWCHKLEATLEGRREVIYRLDAELLKKSRKEARVQFEKGESRVAKSAATWTFLSKKSIDRRPNRATAPDGREAARRIFSQIEVSLVFLGDNRLPPLAAALKSENSQPVLGAILPNNWAATA